MCQFIFKYDPCWSGVEYVTEIRIGDGSYHHFACDVFPEKKTVEITLPFEKELYHMLTPKCRKQLEKILWQKISVRQFFRR